MKTKSNFKHHKSKIPNIYVKFKKEYIGIPPKKPKKFKSKIDRLIDRLIDQLDTTPEPKFGGRTLKAGWTIQAKQDIVSMQGVDIQKELVNSLSKDIKKKIDSEFYKKSFKECTKRNAKSLHSIRR